MRKFGMGAVFIGGLIGAASAGGFMLGVAKLDTFQPQLVGDFELVRIQWNADGSESRRFNERYITFEYAVGTPGKITIIQLEDVLFVDGFDNQPFRGGAQ